MKDFATRTLLKKIHEHTFHSKLLEKDKRKLVMLRFNLNLILNTVIMIHITNKFIDQFLIPIFTSSEYNFLNLIIRFKEFYNFYNNNQKVYIF